ncbi:response regulator [Flavitalea flava]
MDNEYKDFPILIVDDDKDLCSLLCVGLNQYPVHTESNLSAAYSFIAGHKVSLIFLDNSLPDGKGINFIKEVTGQDPNIKIVIMTADQSPELKENAIGEGASVFIAKPFNLAVIKNIAEDIFKNRPAA